MNLQMRIRGLLCSVVLLAGASSFAATPSAAQAATWTSMQGALAPVVLGATENGDLTKMSHAQLFAERQRLEDAMPNVWLPMVVSGVGFAFFVPMFLEGFGSSVLIAIGVVGGVALFGGLAWLVIQLVRRAPMSQRHDALNDQLNRTPNDEYIPPPPPPSGAREPWGITVPMQLASF
jgi:hypothetical protein